MNHGQPLWPGHQPRRPGREPLPWAGSAMHVECRTCPVRGSHCDDCVITALLDLGRTAEEERLELTGQEWAAVSNFVRAGLLGPDAARDLWAERPRAGVEAQAWGETMIS